MGHARFYAPDLVAGADLVDLPEDESRHLTRVLRLDVGDDVLVFDGQGSEWHARVERAGRGRVRVRVLESVTPAREPRVALTLVQAVLKGDRMDDVVCDAVMMGVIAIQPIVTTRTQVSLSTLARGAAVDRWRRVAVASAKQCRRAVVPAVRAPIAIEQYTTLDAGPGTPRLMLVEPAVAAASVRDARELAGWPRPPAVHLVIGPEGGWAPEEVRVAAASGLTPMTFGGRTLRADAMPIVAIAVLQFVWGDLSPG